MENITIGQIAIFLAFIVGLIGSLEFILIRLKRWFKSALNVEMKPIKEEIANTELNSCMNYLVFAIEKAKKDNCMSEAEKRRFYEVLDVYENKYHKNSYIHNEVENLIKSGII